MIIPHTLFNRSDRPENMSLKFNIEMDRQLIENHICVLVHHLISKLNRKSTLVKLFPEMLTNEFINSTIIRISAFKNPVQVDLHFSVSAFTYFYLMWTPTYKRSVQSRLPADHLWYRHQKQTLLQIRGKVLIPPKTDFLFFVSSLPRGIKTKKRCSEGIAIHRIGMSFP